MISTRTLYRRMLTRARRPDMRATDEQRQAETGVPPTNQPSNGDRKNPADGVPWGVRAAAAWSWRVVLIGGVVAGVLYLLWMFRLITIPVFVALLLTALLQPAVRGLRRVGTPRLLAAAVVFVGGIALVGALFYGLTELVISGLNQLGNAITLGIEQIRRWLETGPLQIEFAQLDQLTQRVQDWVRQNIRRITQGAITTVTVLIRLIVGLLLALVITFFFLYDGRQIWLWIVRLFPYSAEDRVDGAGVRAWETLAGYVQGTVIVALFDAVLITILLISVGLPMPLAIPLGVLVFFGAFVPLVGALVTGFLAVLVTLVIEGFVAALITLGGVIVVQQIEGNLLQPLVLGRMVKLHPLAVLLAVTAGSILAGIAGAVVAVPLAAVLNTAFIYFVRGTQPADTPAAKRPRRPLRS